MTAIASPQDVLGKLLLFQEILVELPDEAHIGEYTRRTLRGVPGVADALICFGGRMVPPADGFETICALCAQAANAPDSLDLAACNALAGGQCFPVWTTSQLFGLLIVRIADEDTLRLSRGFLANVANAVAMVLDTRQYQAQLAATNDQLREARDELEQRVAERTQEVARANLRLQRLSEQLLQAQENERRHIARELHDEIGQAFTAVRINLESTSLRIDNAELRARMHSGMQLIDHALELIHDLALDLRPPQLDDLGLTAALRWHIDRQAQASGMRISFEADDLPARLHPEVTIACFRIVQEALTNIIRHARAQQAWIALHRRDRTLVLTMRDDGAGFDGAAKSRTSLGLLGMQERASLVGGRLEIETRAGKGTRIEAILPLRRMPGRSRTPKGMPA